MHDDHTKKRMKQYYLHVKRSFYSYCRNEQLDKIDDDTTNEIIEEFKEKYGNMNINNYILLIDRLNREVHKKNISKNDAVITLINVVDPTFEMYRLFDEICNYSDYKKEVMKKFKFFDEDFLNVEKTYIENNELIKDHIWAYKKSED